MNLTLAYKALQSKTLGLFEQSDVFIPFDYNNVSGIATFMRNLQSYLAKNDYRTKKYYHHARHIFFPVQYHKSIIKRIRQKHGKIVQRLDGIWYPEKHPTDHQQRNKDVKDIYLNYADFVVFQSEYSKRQVFELYGQKPNHAFQVILNGVDKNVFYPGTNTKLSQPVRFITTGGFRNADMLEPIVLALDELKGSIDFKLIVVGPVTHKGLMTYMDRSYIEWHNGVDIGQVANLLRASDVFIYSHLNPPCPNSVLEAISCGLPVVGFDSGAMKELCFFSKELLAPVNHDTFQRYADFDHEALKDKLELSVQQFDRFKKTSLNHCHLYDFETCGSAYLNVFKQVFHG